MPLSSLASKRLLTVCILSSFLVGCDGGSDAAAGNLVNSGIETVLATDIEITQASDSDAAPRIPDTNPDTNPGTNPDTNPDTTPDVFRFASLADVAFNTGFESNEITIRGITSPTAISIWGGAYSLNGASYTRANGTLNNGDTLRVRLISAASFAAATTAHVQIGGTSGSFVSTTYSQYLTPDRFSFADQSGVALSTPLESNPITVSGINTDIDTAISISGGAYSINGGAFTRADGTVDNDATVRVRLTSSSDYNTAANATLTIGGISDSFDITTRAFLVAEIGIDMDAIHAAGQRFDMGCYDPDLPEQGAHRDSDCLTVKNPSTAALSPVALR
ncbi:MAG: hypothetical protein V7629_02560 [Motiliproteus sp.]